MMRLIMFAEGPEVGPGGSGGVLSLVPVFSPKAVPGETPWLFETTISVGLVRPEAAPSYIRSSTLWRERGSGI